MHTKGHLSGVAKEVGRFVVHHGFVRRRKQLTYCGECCVVANTTHDDLSRLEAPDARLVGGWRVVGH